MKNLPKSFLITFIVLFCVAAQCTLTILEETRHSFLKPGLLVMNLPEKSSYKEIRRPDMKPKDRNHFLHCPLSRRLFLKNSVFATAALTLKPSALFAVAKKPPSPKSIVAISENLKAITDNYKIYPKRVREMIDEGSAHADPQGLDHKIIISQDRVATDFVGFEIINARRKEKGISPITKEKAGIIWSAEKLGIGNADPNKIEVRKVQLTT